MRVIIDNPPGAYCDLRGTIVKVTALHQRQSRDRPIATAEIVKIGPHYDGDLKRIKTSIYIYKKISRQVAWEVVQ